MRKRDFIFALVCTLTAVSVHAASLDTLPLLPAELAAGVADDWLVKPIAAKAGVFKTANPNELVLGNGLVSRTFRIAPDAATVGLENLRAHAAVLRGVKPEATIEIDGKPYDIGGLKGQPDYAYLKPEWIAELKADPAAFHCTGFDVGQTVAPFDWKRVRHAADLPWPAPGVSLTLHFAAPEGGPKDITVDLHYELYDGLPVFGKWLTVRNAGSAAVRLTHFTSEWLAVVEEDAIVDRPAFFRTPQSIQIESDYAFAGMDVSTANKVAQWLPDPDYTTQVNYRLETPVLLACRPPLGPDAEIAGGTSLETFRIYELLHDSTEKERRGLAFRRMQRALSPWCTENPILFHATSMGTNAVKLAVDQSAEVGAEMVILSFGSGLNMERDDADYTAHVKELVDYAHAKGIELGGYSLLASRRISDKDDVINPKTGTIGGAIFDNSPCLGSEWGAQYFDKITKFIAATGVDVLEHDGSYPGDVCASTTHPGHRGLEDSQWTQWRKIAQFYHDCRARGTYLNVPDWYFMSGSSKTGMGYREVNWSLPRDRQILLGRQNIYDGTWAKTPSMGWMFVPLVQYHGGGEAATLEPLHEHLDAFEAHLVQNFGCGVQACYRGPRWYDTDETKALVTKWIAWYKQYRQVLDADLIHVRRADGLHLDAMLHVNPTGTPRGMLLVFNPASEAQSETMQVPLYFTGIESEAKIREGEGEAKTYPLARDYSVALPVNIPAHAARWFVIE